MRRERPVRDVCDFLFDTLLARHGTRHAAEMELLDLIASVHEHKRGSARVALFARFLDNDLGHARASRRALARVRIYQQRLAAAHAHGQLPAGAAMFETTPTTNSSASAFSAAAAASTSASGATTARSFATPSSSGGGGGGAESAATPLPAPRTPSFLPAILYRSSSSSASSGGGEAGSGGGSGNGGNALLNRLQLPPDALARGLSSSATWSLRASLGSAASVSGSPVASPAPGSGSGSDGGGIGGGAGGGRELNELEKGEPDRVAHKEQTGSSSRFDRLRIRVTGADEEDDGEDDDLHGQVWRAAGGGGGGGGGGGLRALGTRQLVALLEEAEGDADDTDRVLAILLERSAASASTDGSGGSGSGTSGSSIGTGARLNAGAGSGNGGGVPLSSSSSSFSFPASSSSLQSELSALASAAVQRVLAARATDAAWRLPHAEQSHLQRAADESGTVPTLPRFWPKVRRVRRGRAGVRFLCAPACVRACAPRIFHRLALLTHSNVTCSSRRSGLS
jgi:hypothetical protein